MLKDSCIMQAFILTETKGFKRTGMGIPWETFSRHEKEKIIMILQNLWGMQFDTFTLDRVGGFLNGYQLPPDFVFQLDNNVEEWIVSQWNPAINGAVAYAGMGDATIAGMMDTINQATGIRTLFSTSTPRIMEYIKTQGAELAVDLIEQQHLSLKYVLETAINHRWSITETASAMKEGLTLTNQETVWLQKFRVDTYNQQVKYFREGPFKLTEREIAKRARAVTEHRAKIRFKKYQQARANRIAKTELTRAKHFGDIEAHKQAIDKGTIKDAWKTWRMLPGVDKWSSSRMYNGRRIRIHESFFQFGIPGKTTMTNGYAPGEINEGCRLEYSVEV